MFWLITRRSSHSRYDEGCVSRKEGFVLACHSPGRPSLSSYDEGLSTRKEGFSFGMTLDMKVVTQ